MSILVTAFRLDYADRGRNQVILPSQDGLIKQQVLGHVVIEIHSLISRTSALSHLGVLCVFMCVCGFGGWRVALCGSILLTTVFDIRSAFDDGLKFHRRTVSTQACSTDCDGFFNLHLAKQTSPFTSYITWLLTEIR